MLEITAISKPREFVPGLVAKVFNRFVSLADGADLFLFFLAFLTGRRFCVRQARVLI